MFTKLKKPNSKGFTIIEIMIVLAIAALILLIVLLAVPALQRGSRNTQRKNDATAIVSAVGDYVNNNNGSFPTTSGQFSTEFSNENPSLGYYTTASNLTWTYQTSAKAVNDPNDLDKVVVANYAVCVGNPSAVKPGGATTQTSGASSRDYVVLYDIEGSGNVVIPQCIQS